MNNFNRVSELRISVEKNSRGKTVITDSYFTAPFKIMKPFERNDGGITVFQQSASAGIMAGDTQQHNFSVGSGAILELVSQSFEKIFKMEDNGYASRNICATVLDGGTLIYNPLPCMPFAGSNFESRTKIELSGAKSRLIYQDCICCGRKAHGEEFDFKQYANLVEIIRDNKLIYRDNTIFEGSDCGLFSEKKQFLQKAGMFGNYSHLGTKLFFGFELKPSDLFQPLGLDEKLLYTAENLEKQKKENAPLVSVTQTEGSGIAVRVLANSAEEVQKIFEKITL